MNLLTQNCRLSLDVLAPTPPCSPGNMLYNHSESALLSADCGNIVVDNIVAKYLKDCEESTSLPNADTLDNVVLDEFINDMMFTSAADMNELSTRMDCTSPLNFSHGKDLNASMDCTSPVICCHGKSSDDCCYACLLGDAQCKQEQVLNDCMWAQPHAPAKAATPLSSTPPATPTDVTSCLLPKRKHLDSTSSRNSDADYVSWENVFAPEESSVSMGTPRLETPSESSDAETDAEEHEAAHQVFLDHNYYQQYSQSRRSEQKNIASPLMRALNKVSMAQQPDSEDEIDVVGTPDDPSPLRDIRERHPAAYSPSPCSPGRRSRRYDGEHTAYLGAGRAGKSLKRCVEGKVAKLCERRSSACSNSSSSSANSMAYNAQSRLTSPMDPQKRSLHNSMERMRRVDLKNCFDLVRSKVPALKDRTRAPKVLILKSAVELMGSLQRGIERRRKEAVKLRQQNEMLRMEADRLRI